MHTLKTGLSFAEAEETRAAARIAGSATLRIFEDTKDQDEKERKGRGVRESERANDDLAGQITIFIYLQMCHVCKCQTNIFPRLPE